MLLESLGEPEKAIVEGIGIPRTTLGRQKIAGRLGSAESERAVRLALLMALGKTALGSVQSHGKRMVVCRTRRFMGTT